MNAHTAHTLRTGLKTVLVTAITLAVLVLFLSPFAFMVFTSLKTPAQRALLGAPIWPAAPVSVDYNGKKVDMFNVPVKVCAGFNPNDPSTQALALVKKGLKESTFIDPNNPSKGEFKCTLSWRATERIFTFSPSWDNYVQAWDLIDFPRVLWNTLFYALVTGFGTVVSCTLVAYGFSRFQFPGRDLLFIILISTIFLPFAVTIIPTYAFFVKLNLIGTWWPLILPHFFSNAFNVFLLRQYFMTLPRELDEAATIDGAGPMRVLWSVILPQAKPVLMAITVFHIVFAWNDFFAPLLYLKRLDQPISVALNNFNGIYGNRPELIQAGAMMALGLPLLLFIVAQRFFIQGIVITGVEK
jgi:multiple sugar transport system permease protein